MKKTRVCDILGVQYPIIQGGMLWLATAELAAAVSEAGALGVISPFAGMVEHGDPAGHIQMLIKRVRSLTEKPFGVNLPLDLEQSGVLIDIILRQKVGIVITAAGNPAHYTAVLKQQGIKVLHVISSVKQAQKAAICKVDAIIAEGVEAAGHSGFDQLPLFSLIPQVVDAISIPVVAAGGIVDGRGLIAAMALGAEGVQMGTRFIAVKECIAHPKYKQAILDAKDTDTIVTSRKLLPTRSLRTALSKKLLEMDESGASPDEIRTFLGYRRARKGQLEGNLTNGEAYCGASAGLIKEIIPAALVVQRLIEGYEMVMKRLLSQM
jgi:enoyl-[acyl-carrier protein] reductase II